MSSSPLSASASRFIIIGVLSLTRTAVAISLSLLFLLMFTDAAAALSLPYVFRQMCSGGDCGICVPPPSATYPEPAQYNISHSSGECQSTRIATCPATPELNDTCVSVLTVSSCPTTITPSSPTVPRSLITAKTTLVCGSCYALSFSWYRLECNFTSNEVIPVTCYDKNCGSCDGDDDGGGVIPTGNGAVSNVSCWRAAYYDDYFIFDNNNNLLPPPASPFYPCSAIRWDDYLHCANGTGTYRLSTEKHASGICRSGAIDSCIYEFPTAPSSGAPPHHRHHPTSTTPAPPDDNTPTTAPPTTPRPLDPYTDQGNMTNTIHRVKERLQRFVRGITPQDPSWNMKSDYWKGFEWVENKKILNIAFSEGVSGLVVTLFASEFQGVLDLSAVSDLNIVELSIVSSATTPCRIGGDLDFAEPGQFPPNMIKFVAPGCNFSSKHANFVGISFLELDLSRNKLSGPLGGKFSMARKLDLSHNQITGPFVPEVFTSPWLTSLDLSHNRLRGDIGATLSRLANPWVAGVSSVLPIFGSGFVVDLSHNYLYGTPDLTLLPEFLTSLNLSSNLLAGVLDITMLQGTSHLHTLDVTNNYFNLIMESKKVLAGLRVYRYDRTVAFYTIEGDFLPLPPVKYCTSDDMTKNAYFDVNIEGPVASWSTVEEEVLYNAPRKAFYYDRKSGFIPGSPTMLNEFLRATFNPFFYQMMTFDAITNDFILQIFQLDNLDMRFRTPHQALSFYNSSLCGATVTGSFRGWPSKSLPWFFALDIAANYFNATAIWPDLSVKSVCSVQNPHLSWVGWGENGGGSKTEMALLPASIADCLDPRQRPHPPFSAPGATPYSVSIARWPSFLISGMMTYVLYFGNKDADKLTTVSLAASPPDWVAAPFSRWCFNDAPPLVGGGGGGTLLVQRTLLTAASGANVSVLHQSASSSTAVQTCNYNLPLAFTNTGTATDNEYTQSVPTRLQEFIPCVYPNASLAGLVAFNTLTNAIRFSDMYNFKQYMWTTASCVEVIPPTAAPVPSSLSTTTAAPTAHSSSSSSSSAGNNNNNNNNVYCANADGGNSQLFIEFNATTSHANLTLIRQSGRSVVSCDMGVLFRYSNASFGGRVLLFGEVDEGDQVASSLNPLEPSEKYIAELNRVLGRCLPSRTFTGDNFRTPWRALLALEGNRDVPPPPAYSSSATATDGGSSGPHKQQTGAVQIPRLRFVDSAGSGLDLLRGCPRPSLLPSCHQQHDAGDTTTAVTASSSQASPETSPPVGAVHSDDDARTVFWRAASTSSSSSSFSASSSSQGGSSNSDRSSREARRRQALSAWSDSHVQPLQCFHISELLDSSMIAENEQCGNDCIPETCYAKGCGSLETQGAMQRACCLQRGILGDASLMVNGSLAFPKKSRGNSDNNNTICDASDAGYNTSSASSSALGSTSVYEEQQQQDRNFNRVRFVCPDSYRGPAQLQTCDGSIVYPVGSVGHLDAQCSPCVPYLARKAYATSVVLMILLAVKSVVIALFMTFCVNPILTEKINSIKLAVIEGLMPPVDPRHIERLRRLVESAQTPFFINPDELEEDIANLLCVENAVSCHNLARVSAYSPMSGDDSEQELRSTQTSTLEAAAGGGGGGGGGGVEPASTTTLSDAQSGAGGVVLTRAQARLFCSTVYFPYFTARGKWRPWIFRGDESSQLAFRRTVRAIARDVLEVAKTKKEQVRNTVNITLLGTALDNDVGSGSAGNTTTNSASSAAAGKNDGTTTNDGGNNNNNNNNSNNNNNNNNATGEDEEPLLLTSAAAQRQQQQQQQQDSSGGGGGGNIVAAATTTSIVSNTLGGNNNINSSSNRNDDALQWDETDVEEVISKYEIPLLDEKNADFIIFEGTWLTDSFLCTQPWELAIQALLVLAALIQLAVQAITDLEYDRFTPFEKFQIIYFRLLSSGTPLTFFANTIIQLLHVDNAALANRVFLIVSLLLLGPSLVNVVPGIFMYAWLFLPLILLTCIMYHYSHRVFAHYSHMPLDGEETSETLMAKVVRVVYRILLTFLITIIFQAAYNYFFLFTVEKVDYIDVLAVDFSRRRMLCSFSALIESVETLVAVVIPV